MDSRDFIAEMDARITEATAGSGWVAAVVAQKMYGQLLESDPDLLEGWLHAIATQMLRRVIGLRTHQERTVARRRAGARSFADAAADFEMAASEDGRQEAAVRLIGMFGEPHVIDADGTQKRAADMTGPEHLFVAENTYQRTANRALMLGAFHRAVAGKVGVRRTADVLTEVQYAQMYRSIVRSPEGEAA